ncbi:stage II sporulation protein M [Demequina sp. TTPB684]|uniref:stage II sporulation protein M n=1 Tax=unclassified Demequina TaxID=2620311 RepID=UPI001CF5EE40|nr:stage II sporulation protein M [Demequina sp. TMPB413]MCB2413593.1 stage II sporulation protein M [Demequina sp. TTPB684]UPU88554.1 stage II sporulation protein M [Demequina sp. TMPB413]
MDIDAFSALREARWSRLKRLARQRRRTGADADEMTRLYRATASDLSTVRSAAPEPALITRLSMLLGSSRVWLTGSHQVRTGDIGRYFTTSLPAALYRVRWWGTITSLVVVVLSVVAGYYTLNSPAALELIGPPEVRAQIAQEEFASYYVEYDSTSFTALVWTNNAWLAAQCIVLGVTGIFPLILMYNTVVQLGASGAVMAEYDMLDIFFQLILPHGLLELSAVFVAAGAGFKVFWTVLVPGRLPRATALAEVFRTLLSVALGLAIALFLSGLIEGYITGSQMPWGWKVAIGVLAFLAFWLYIFAVGRWASQRGASGDAEQAFRVEVAPVAH